VTTVLDTARGYLAAGLSVIPIRADGSKAPAESGWRMYSLIRPELGQCDKWWGNGHVYGIGIPGGPASGNLAVLDFETWPAYQAWFGSLPPASQAATRLCPLAQPPRGGAHLYVRLTDPVPGVVLARHLVGGKPATLIEVRGDGHQVVAPGSPPQCHPTGIPYQWLRRAWVDGGKCEPLDLVEWFAWTDAAANLNEYTPPPTPPRPDTRSREPRTGTRPGDDFNHNGTWEETGLLEEWKWERSLGDDRGMLTRPGKKAGTSATVGMVNAKDGGHPLFYAFTTNCDPFTPGKGYSRFGVYAKLKHRDDFEAAARALAERGYGEPARKPTPPTFTGGSGITSDGVPVVTPAEPKYKFIDHAEFRTKDYRVSWLIDWFLAKGQPAVVAGPSKGMKTSVLVDTAISLATATPHLNKWKVKERVKVAMVSGESGGFTLQESARRILLSRGLPEDAPDGWLKWEFTLPTFADLIDTAEFAKQLGGLGCEVVIIDPFYLTLGDIDAKNMFEMGRALRAVAELLIVKHGVTPVIAHHANRLLPVGEPMELTHLAFSGLEQFARQYVFLNRRVAYQNDGHHELWYRYGGSAGHSGLYVVGIDEGVLGPETPVRRWEVEITTPADARHQDAKTQRATARVEAHQVTRLDDEAVLLAIDAETTKHPGATRKRIRELASMSDKKVSETLGRLASIIEQVTFTKPGGFNSTQTVTGYRRKQGGLLE
jgi:hypothetical protein